MGKMGASGLPLSEVRQKSTKAAHSYNSMFHSLLANDVYAAVSRYWKDDGVQWHTMGPEPTTYNK